MLVARFRSSNSKHILLEAVKLGLGGVWMAAVPFEDRMNHVIYMFNLQENIFSYSVIPIEYPEEENKFINRYNSKKVHYERW